MEHWKISKLLKDSTTSKFVTRKWIEVNDLSGGQYSINKNIRFETPTSRSDLCDYRDIYIAVKRPITIEGTDNANKRNKNLISKNIAPFKSCMLKINNLIVDDSEDLDIAMSMYNLLWYSDNYCITSGSLWNYYRDDVNGAANDKKKQQEENNK